MKKTPAYRYEHLDRIAIGGTAEVFRARAIDTRGVERPVVLKRVLPQLARDERFRILFVEEAHMVAALDHPNIVQILDFGELDGTCYLALEEIHGRDLGFLLSACAALGERPPLGLAALITSRIASALQFAHEQVSTEGVPLQIIHRDVSPENILLSFQGQVKLGDFGIAKSAINTAREVHPSEQEPLRGKPAYMAPEQASSARHLDHRTDLFALGCVLYELCTGVPPFRGKDDADTLARLRAFSPRPNIHGIDAPQALKIAIDQLLRPLPSERFQHASALVSHLDAYLASAVGPRDEHALGSWVRDLSSRASPPRQSSPEAAVDEAVRALLGAPTEVETHLAPPPDPTSPALTKPTTRRRTSTRQVPAVDPPSADASQNLGDTPGTARAKPALYPIDETLRTQAPPQPRARPLLWPILAILLLLALIPLTWLILRSPSQDDLRRASPAPRDSALPHVETTPALSQKKKPTPTQTRTRIKSVPPGAHIALNGIPRGHTPMTLPWPRGPSVLTFSKPGYHKTTLQLSSPPTEDAPIVVTLRRRRVSPQHPIGFLTVNTLPWSRVYLDGHLLGNTPLIDRHVRAGSHRLVIKDAHGHVRKRVKITVTPGKRQRLTFNLR